MRWRPTQDQLDLIRRLARQEAKVARIRITMLTRANIKDPAKPIHSNIRLVSDVEDWSDTDTFDHVPWATLRKGVELTPAGRGAFDLMVYSLATKEEGEDLKTDIQVYVEAGDLVRIAMGRKTLWESAT